MDELRKQIVDGLRKGTATLPAKRLVSVEAGHIRVLLELIDQASAPPPPPAPPAPAETA